MRWMTVAVLLTVTVGAAVPATGAEQERWVFGLDSRFDGSSNGGWSLLPNFSYFAAPRFRIDGSVGVGYASSDEYSVRIAPGFRYYLRPRPEQWRLSTGLQVGFELFGEHDDVPRLGPVPGLSPFAPDPLVPEPDELMIIRLVPLELEYWLSTRAALALGLDHETRVYDGFELDNREGFGFFVGFRARIK